MKVILQMNTSPPNYVTKSLTFKEEVEGALRTPTSLLSPTIEIVREDPTGFNYFYIPEFHRYYYLTGVSSVYNGLVSISGTVDVLMSYSDQIRDAYAIIRRQENSYNLYLDDGIFKAYSNPRYKQIKFQRGFNGFSYILAVAGNS